jgi:omega-6 fatty acid desaturase (delta-12 desaturase)
MSFQDHAVLRAAVAPFETPSVSRAVFQLFTSLGLYLLLVGLMYWSLSYSYWLTLILSPMAAGLLIRTFIVQHDCGHGSFFRSPRANDITGAVLGLFTLAPYRSWRRQHAQHHANWNNLDRRESGTDIYSACLTVKEYGALSRRQRLLYRLVRHPLIAHIVIPPLVFLVLYRVPFDTPSDWVRERWSVHLTNTSLAAVAVMLGLMFGFDAVLKVQFPIIVVTTIVGVWLFSVQHRFDQARWLRQADWSFQTAAMKGTSYLELPRVLQWFTGNIGFHHIHHLSPRVPNYKLEACHRASAVLREEEPLTLSRAFGAGNLTLWDEARKKLVRFRDAAPILRGDPDLGSGAPPQ